MEPSENLDVGPFLHPTSSFNFSFRFLISFPWNFMVENASMLVSKVTDKVFQRSVELRPYQ